MIFGFVFVYVALLWPIFAFLSLSRSRLVCLRVDFFHPLFSLFIGSFVFVLSVHFRGSIVCRCGCDFICLIFLFCLCWTVLIVGYFLPLFL